MKKLTHIETKMHEVEVVDGWQAEDGMVFPDEKSCLIHEEELNDKAMLNIPHSFIAVCDLLDEGYDGEQYVALYPRNQEEIDTICRCCPEISADAFLSCKSHMFLFVYGGYGHYRTPTNELCQKFDKPEDVYDLGSVDAFFSNMIRRLHRQWDKMIQEVGDGLFND